MRANSVSDRAETCTKIRMLLNGQDANPGRRAHRNSLLWEIATIFGAPAKARIAAGRSWSGTPTRSILIPFPAKKGRACTLEKSRPRTIAFGVGMNASLIHAVGACVTRENHVGTNPPVSEKSPLVVAVSQDTFEDSTRALILQALQATGWVVGGPCGAAARLGLRRTTLISKMNKLGISRPVRRSD